MGCSIICGVSLNSMSDAFYCLGVIKHQTRPNFYILLSFHTAMLVVRKELKPNLVIISKQVETLLLLSPLVRPQTETEFDR